MQINGTFYIITKRRMSPLVRFVPRLASSRLHRRLHQLSRTGLMVSQSFPTPSTSDTVHPAIMKLYGSFFDQHLHYGIYPITQFFGGCLESEQTSNGFS